MNQLLQYFVLLPLAGLVFTAFPSNKQEKAIFGATIFTVGAHLAGMLFFTIWWMATNDFAPVFLKGPVLYESSSSEFSIDFYFDKITAVYGLVSGILIFLVSIFSRYYMHREKGFKRFFNNLLLFYLGVNFILMAGNFETLFIGWEIIGVTSFFLIAFYRDRYLPVKNALKVVSLYRLADICLLLGIWLCHHVFKTNITFTTLGEMGADAIQIMAEHHFDLVIPGVFLVAAMVKSAQLPFSSWLPRAMEGPTTSSAIFYGSLSVHMGVFLMLRTYPFWGYNAAFQAIVILIGLSTSLVATSISRVQSSVKTQIAYSSIAQIGLIFVEVALGFHKLALFHFAGNAFLRTYQLLVSPSVLNYLIHDQFFNFIPPQHDIKDSFWGKLKLSLYVLSIKEWNLDWLMYRYLWTPIKKAGQLLQFIDQRIVWFFFLPVYLVGLFYVHQQERLAPEMHLYLPGLFAFIGLTMALRAFVERKNAFTGLSLIVMNQLFTSLSIAFNEQFEFEQIYIYLSGIVVSAVVAYLCLKRLQSENESVTLDRFHGHSYERPRLTVVFLVACLGLSGFPISPTFIGEDLILGHIHENQYLLTGLTTLNLILDGLAIFRIYGRIFLGPHNEGYHEVAYRSS